MPPKKSWNREWVRINANETGHGSKEAQAIALLQLSDICLFAFINVAPIYG
jgi:hypothetical protein